MTSAVTSLRGTTGNFVFGSTKAIPLVCGETRMVKIPVEASACCTERFDFIALNKDLGVIKSVHCQDFMILKDPYRSRCSFIQA
jgi:hypothetical protein